MSERQLRDQTEYEFLGVPENATQVEIIRALDVKADEFYDDEGEVDDLEEISYHWKLEKIERCIGTPAARAEYDRKLAFERSLAQITKKKDRQNHQRVRADANVQGSIDRALGKNQIVPKDFPSGPTDPKGLQRRRLVSNGPGQSSLAGFHLQGVYDKKREVVTVFAVPGHQDRRGPAPQITRSSRLQDNYQEDRKRIQDWAREVHNSK